MAEIRQQDLLDALKLELTFLERGGYEPSVREPRKTVSIFLDSPSCLNYELPAKEHPCSECWLIDFVPAEKRGEAIPCHHIPLNHRGDTVEALGGPCDDPEVKTAMRDWLRRTIQQLERAPQSRQPA
jgi:hypothetical protein